MFKIESYVTPILLSYVDKYVRDFRPADAQVSLWGGGVALHNLVLKADVLQKEVALPFTLVSGRIHELLIQVPWTKIMSEPIVVTIDTIECILSLNPPAPDETSPPDTTSSSRRTQLVEAPPGYMQALVRRIVSNIALRVHHLIVKYVQDDIVLSLNVKHLSIDSTGENWEPSFADIDQVEPVVRRLFRLDDLTLCLDRSDSDGKIRFYQEPLLYRCQLDLRVLTRLVSANIRRASSLSIQLRSKKLAWGVTSDQLILLLRLLKERSGAETKTSPSSAKTSTVVQSTPLHSTSSNLTVPNRTESWSEWAWSWLPAWTDREGGVEEPLMPATPTPIYFTAFFHDISIVFKIMEMEGGCRKRPRNVLELVAAHAAVKSAVLSPTIFRVKIGARTIVLKSVGKCVCGHVDTNALNEEPTIYLSKIQRDEDWDWPDLDLSDIKLETAEVAGEDYVQHDVHEGVKRNGQNENTSPEKIISQEEEFWQKMSPLVFLDYTHERSPPSPYTNPYDNPPTDFQYSDWEEECKLDIHLQPLELRVCMGLIHRVLALRNLYQEIEVTSETDLPMRTLTVEECDALLDNLPQRRINIEVKSLCLLLYPWDHSIAERPSKPQLYLHLEIPKGEVVVTSPLYPYRVCSAACQMPGNSSPLMRCARLNVTADLSSVQAKICSPYEGQAKPCARTDLRIVTHVLLNPHYFKDEKNIKFSYSIIIREISLSGSSARLQAAWQVITSLITQRVSTLLKHTTLAKDALSDEELVALDVTLEELSLRGYLTENITTHIATLQSARTFAFHSLEGEPLKQAWVFSAPDGPSSTPFLRVAGQWCWVPSLKSLDYLGVWMEPATVCVDPLLVAWLAYNPRMKPFVETQPASLSRTISSTMYFMRRRATPPSSSGRAGSRSGSGAELVHVRPCSIESSSEPSEKKEPIYSPPVPKPKDEPLKTDSLLQLHQRLKHMLITVDLGLILVYVTSSTASAIDCATVLLAMERHVTSSQSVLTVSMGRWSLHSSSLTRHLWQDIKHDGPTYIDEGTHSLEESFPWKVRFADVSCYTLEYRASSERTEKPASGLRSQLKPTHLVYPRIILELVTTTLTLSLVTKSVAYKTTLRKPEVKKYKEPDTEEKRMKYFTTGSTFVPTTLKEFVRGPASRKKPNEEEEVPEKTDTEPEHKITTGPVVSLGVHVHADTPPVIVRLDRDQVNVVAAAVHCFSHITTLLQRPPIIIPRKQHSPVALIGSNKSLRNTVSEIDEQHTTEDSTESEERSRSELIQIFQAHPDHEKAVPIKKFLWFQWVISHATVLVAAEQVKLAFNVEDIINTIDLQEHYNQLKVKIASASIKHYGRTDNDEWKAGVLGGRILEARESADPKEDDHFLAITVTQAQISNLPASWKEELHPKLLEQKDSTDSMWEVYATLAPLEAVLQPTILDNIMSLVREMAPPSFCSLETEMKGRNVWPLPFCYITAGGLRLLVTGQNKEKNMDDTFVIVCGRTIVNPHPENPICRRPINIGADSGWQTVEGGLEGRQYEMIVKNVAVRSAQFTQLVFQEESESELFKVGGENPARKWSEPVVTPNITPVLHPVDISCVAAPALFVGGMLICGPGLEFNLMSDCSIELNFDQLNLINRVTGDLTRSYREHIESDSSLDDNSKNSVCPYATLLKNSCFMDELSNSSETTIADEITKTPSEIGRSVTGDSGVDTITSRSTLKSGRNLDDSGIKKNVSVGFYEMTANAKDHFELFITMGTIELSLYTVDDNSPEVIPLRLQKPLHKSGSLVQESPEEATSKNESVPVNKVKSLTETNRTMDTAKTAFGLLNIVPNARKAEGNIPLIHVSLQQPNLYYWKKKSNKSIQISLFNAWIGLGAGQSDDHSVLMSAARGVPDPVTEIPPALATVKLMMPLTGNLTAGTVTSSRGDLQLDIERPVLFEVCSERLIRLNAIHQLMISKLMTPHTSVSASTQLPVLYKLRRLMVQHSIETVTIQTSQVGVSGFEGSIGWDSASVQVAWGARPERLLTRALLSALLISAGSPHDPRHEVLHPLQIGLEVDATWESWRKIEGGLSIREPTVHIGINLDRITIELRPSDLAALQRMEDILVDLKSRQQSAPAESNSSQEASARLSAVNFESRMSSCSVDNGDFTDHHYKDDLRSGAFKIVRGGQLPMAYQVMLHGNAVSWRYPHPRAITRLVAFPIPGQDQEVECVLEMYNRMLTRWEPHTYFSLPVNDAKEIQLYVPPPEAVFATMWRFCVRRSGENKVGYEFRMNKFLPRQEPLVTEVPTEPDVQKDANEVTAEQLSGVLRVDSYFAPRLLPRGRLSLQLTALEIHIHNALPPIINQPTPLEGYYVTKPLRRSHRVLTLSSKETTVHADMGSPAGVLVLVKTLLLSEVLDCATGAMDRLVDEFDLQAGVSIPGGKLNNAKLRFRTSNIHVTLHVPRLRTLRALAGDWQTSFKQYMNEHSPSSVSMVSKTNRQVTRDTTAALEGRVSLWLHNSCTGAFRVGQEETDEVVPLESGTRLAYRWRNPTAPKRLRFALAGPSTDWHWSNGISFSSNKYRVRLEDTESLQGNNQSPGSGMFLYINVEQTGSYRCMNLSGRLVLANMLRFGLLYKVRARVSDSSTWRTISTGDLAAECIGRSIVCGANYDLVLKMKFSNHDVGWSGDIPLKECPKENVPWLVKVPSEGDLPYISVWCRVVRARSDGRILATIWPLYVLHSHLPLDTDVLIVTETGLQSTVQLEAEEARPPPPLIQSAPGRGTSTYILAPGTTSARHSLSFQYRNIECPVTREAVPLHYGVTDTSVFDKQAPVTHIEEVIRDIKTWLARSGRNASSSWPYSLVSKHWPGTWQPALLQPRCDVTVRYQAVRVGGGCSLEIHLSPVVLLCNASPLALTLRAYDAAPLCKLEPGTAISPPSMILEKPFFMSVEMGRETFVSGQLEVSSEEPGRYGSPPPGQVAIDHAANFAIQCNQKVALFTLYYEIKEEINLLGISSTYALVNMLDTDLLVSAIAVSFDNTKDIPLHPKSFKLVEQAKHGRYVTVPLARFWLRDRWRGGDASQLNTFLCVAIPVGAYPASAPVPVRLGKTPVRRAISLIDNCKNSVAVVVTQHKHEGRWIITVAKDPCPQFVVHNRTNHKVAVAQPVHNENDTSASSTLQIVPDCSGARWWCTVEPDAMTHYSTPSYCARHPNPPDAFSSVPFLTFSRVKEDSEPDWCAPIAVADGEQLVQVCRGLTVKLRVRTHPHSTLIELQDVDQNDISASDIRRRLIGSFSCDDVNDSDDNQNMILTESLKLERTGANEKLLEPNPREAINTLDGLQICSETSINTIQKPIDSCTKQIHTLKSSIDEEFIERPVKEKASPPVRVVTVSVDKEFHMPSHKADFIPAVPSELTIAQPNLTPEACSLVFQENVEPEFERVRCVIASLAIDMATTGDIRPLLALHIDRAAFLMISHAKKTTTTLSIADLQIDNLQHDSGQFDFAVVATTRAESSASDPWPALWNMFAEQDAFSTRQDDARLMLNTCHDEWAVVMYKFKELTEIVIRLGPLALYIEDAYVTALVELFRLAVPPTSVDDNAAVLTEAQNLQCPLRLRLLYIHPLDLTLTLHTAVRMYIALDQSPLHLSAFKLRNMMTSTERLAHALTVHYLSAAILGAGWVVGGLELLGAPGAVAARVSGATGGVRGVAAAAAAALLRSLSAWAGSLARNLDILAGDEEHARRAAAARRRYPDSFVAGLAAGITNFAINILGAVGGLAHHPLVSVAVGETESSAAALRRGLLGALTKPLSATADLVAYAGHGLLKQTGWDPVPQPRPRWATRESTLPGWRRDCVRWMFRLAELSVLAGFEVLLNNAHLQLLLTHKFLIVADPETERVVEMIDLRFCSLEPYHGTTIELCVSQRRSVKITEPRAVDEDDEYQVSAAAMARVARYTGAEGAPGIVEYRVMQLMPLPGQSYALYSALTAAIHHNSDSHFPLL